MIFLESSARKFRVQLPKVVAVELNIYLFGKRQKDKTRNRLPCPLSQVIWGSGKPFAEHLMKSEFPNSVDIS